LPMQTPVLRLPYYEFARIILQAGNA
jgi:hypothetical protein